MERSRYLHTNKRMDARTDKTFPKIPGTHHILCSTLSECRTLDVSRTVLIRCTCARLLDWGIQRNGSLSQANDKHAGSLLRRRCPGRQPSSWGEKRKKDGIPEVLRDTKQIKIKTAWRWEPRKKDAACAGRQSDALASAPPTIPRAARRRSDFLWKRRSRIRRELE